MLKKKLLLLSVLLACITFACDNDNNDEGTDGYSDSQAVVDNEVFKPSKLKAVKTGQTLKLSFTSGSRSIDITTNDTISGTYEIAGPSLKSKTLDAIIIYTNGTDTYNGKSGRVTIVVGQDGAVAGTYDATVVSDNDVEVEIKSGVFSKIEVVSKEEDTPDPVTEEAINDTLTNCYSSFQDFIKFSFLFDAVYSSNVSGADASGQGSASVGSVWNSTWDDIYNHKQNPTNEKISQFWTTGWNIISLTNFVINNSSETILIEESANKIIAEAKTIRAYTYYTLLTWFGDLPFILNTDQEQVARFSESEILSQVTTDLEAAIEVLPFAWSDNQSDKVIKSFTQGILCRIYLQSKDYVKALNICQSLIDGGNYQLETEVDNFTASNKEIYWGFDKGNNEEFNTFFTKGDYVPAIRYTETLLIYAEGAYQAGQQMKAMETINMLKNRRGENSITEINADTILIQWRMELNNEGSIFNALKRHEKVKETLDIDDYMQKLPIPQFVIEENPQMTQNAGY
jgi:hypothetical protein